VALRTLSPEQCGRLRVACGNEQMRLLRMASAREDAGGRALDDAGIRAFMGLADAMGELETLLTSSRGMAVTVTVERKRRTHGA
jgi:hypothetical protein